MRSRNNITAQRTEWHRGNSLRGNHRGLTLVEMVAVVLIITMLLAISITAVVGINKADAVNQASRQVANAMQCARGDAIANNRRTRLVFVGGSACAAGAGGENAFAWVYKSFSIIAKDKPTLSDSRSDAWSYIEGWNFLPAGAVFVAGSLDALPTITITLGGTGTAVPLNYIEFKPSGRAASAGTLVIAEGFTAGSTISPATTVTNARNNVIITWDDLSGKIRVLRPQVGTATPGD